MSGSALVISLLLAYASMLCFCLGMERHWKHFVGTLLPSAWRRACPPLGGVLLGLAGYAASVAWPGAMALVGGFGLVSLSGMALLLLLPFAPRLALWLPIGGGLVCGLATLL